MSRVVEFTASRKMREAVNGRSAPRKPRPKKPASADPRVSKTDRTFEFIYTNYTNDQIYPIVRIRFKKGAHDDNIFQVGGINVFMGLVSVPLPRDKWSPYTWGHIPVTVDAIVREVVDDTPPTVLKKDETKNG